MYYSSLMTSTEKQNWAPFICFSCNILIAIFNYFIIPHIIHLLFSVNLKDFFYLCLYHCAIFSDLFAVGFTMLFSVLRCPVRMEPWWQLCRALPVRYYSGEGQVWSLFGEWTTDRCWVILSQFFSSLLKVQNNCESSVRPSPFDFPAAV